VRGRALADLAEVVDCFAALLAQEPSSEQHQVAEAFVEGLGAAAALTVSNRALFYASLSDFDVCYALQRHELVLS
jgi:hypothetical protein